MFDISVRHAREDRDPVARIVDTLTPRRPKCASPSRWGYLVGLPLAATVLLSMLSACTHDGPPPNILLLVVDTLRADRLAAYGNRNGLTPYIDGLAARATVFANAYSTSSWTCPAVASLMTSRDPRQHRVSTFSSRLASEEVTVAEILQSHGYRTAGFSANWRLLEHLGYAQGFEEWRSNPGNVKLRADHLRAEALAWLDAAREQRPTLLYFQFMEPHGPYQPPEPYRSRHMRNPLPETELAELFKRLVIAMQPETLREAADVAAQLYDGEVASLDHEISTLFAELEHRHFLDDAIIILTADHGEEFMEHGGTTHGTALFNECVRIPFLIIAPGYEGGRRIEANVSLMDIAPTIVELLGIPPEPRFEGRSLVHFLEPSSTLARLRTRLVEVSRTQSPRDVLFRLDAIGLGPDQRKHTAGILRGNGKLLRQRDGTTEFFDLSRDAGEQHANPVGSADEASKLAGTLDRYAAELERRSAPTRKEDELDDATREKLRALGYGH